MQKRKLINGLVYVLLIGFLIFFVSKKLTETLSGEAISDLGRDHVTDIAGVVYNSNPPTSGPHFPIWAKKGVYDRLISDGYLIHSLEHGYVVIYYGCSKLVPSAYQLVSNAYAHDEPTNESSDSGQLLKHMKLKQTDKMSAFTPENAPEIEISLPDEFKSESCKSLVNQLSTFINKFERIIIVPRVGMDTEIALTAWNRIEKLDKFDSDRILNFIKDFHNKGPEKTAED